MIQFKSGYFMMIIIFSCLTSECFLCLKNDKKPLPMKFISNGFSYGNLRVQTLFKPASQTEHNQ